MGGSRPELPQCPSWLGHAPRSRPPQHQSWRHCWQTVPGTRWSSSFMLKHISFDSPVLTDGMRSLSNEGEGAVIDPLESRFHFRGVPP